MQTSKQDQAEKIMEKIEESCINTIIYDTDREIIKRILQDNLPEESPSDIVADKLLNCKDPSIALTHASAYRIGYDKGLYDGKKPKGESPLDIGEKTTVKSTLIYEAGYNEAKRDIGERIDELIKRWDKNNEINGSIIGRAIVYDIRRLKDSLSITKKD